MNFSFMELEPPYDYRPAAFAKKDSLHTIVYVLPRVYDRKQDTTYGYHQGITMLDIPDDDNICRS